MRKICTLPTSFMINVQHRCVRFVDGLREKNIKLEPENIVWNYYGWALTNQLINVHSTLEWLKFSPSLSIKSRHFSKLAKMLIKLTWMMKWEILWMKSSECNVRAWIYRKKNAQNVCCKFERKMRREKKQEKRLNSNLTKWLNAKVAPIFALRLRITAFLAFFCWCIRCIEFIFVLPCFRLFLTVHTATVFFVLFVLLSLVRSIIRRSSESWNGDCLPFIISKTTSHSIWVNMFCR